MSEEDQAVDEFTTADRGARKYLLIKVPDFATDPSGDPGTPPPDTAPQDEKDKFAERQGRFGQPMTSYLRLGTMIDNDIGDELIQHAYDAGPAGKKEGSPFIDDERNRGTGADNPTGADGHGLTATERVNFHTQYLKSKGGWRDHSDGNRITTTYGDKVEVIRGNYKMVVLGRQDDPGNAMGWDATGNHIQDYAQATMPGASVAVEWIQNAYVPNTFPAASDDSNGTHTALIAGNSAATTTPVIVDDDEYKGGAWLLINSTERVYQYSRNAGNFREQQWGDRVESYTGSENPARIGKNDDDGYQGHPNDAAYHSVAAKNYDDDDLAKRIRPSSKGLPRGNPHVIEKTWASKIESYTGSSKWRIPKTYESSYINDSESHEDVTTKTEHSTVGTQTSTSTVTTQTDTSTVTTLTETTTVGTHVSTTFAGLVLDTTFVGASNETTIAGAKSEITIAGAMSEITLSPVGKLSIEAMPLAAEIGIILGKIALTIGWGKEFKIGDVDEVPLRKKKMTLQELKFALSKSNYTLKNQRASLDERTEALIAQYKALQVYLGA